jgi:hypothetical protein
MKNGRSLIIKKIGKCVNYNKIDMCILILQGQPILYVLSTSWYLSVIIEQISASYDNNKTKTQVMRGNERKRNKKHCGQQRFLLLSPPSTKRESQKNK